MEGRWGGASFTLSTPAAEQCCHAVPEHAPSSWATVEAAALGGSMCPFGCRSTADGGEWCMPARLLVSGTSVGATWVMAAAVS